MCEPEPPGPERCTGQPRQGGGRGKYTLMLTFMKNVAKQLKNQMIQPVRIMGNYQTLLINT